LEPNPYAPPADDRAPPASDAPVAEGVPAYKLYTPEHVTLATFLGTPAAGLFLMSVNRRRLGRAKSATNTLLAGLLMTLALLALSAVLPGNSGILGGLATTVGVGKYAK